MAIEIEWQVKPTDRGHEETAPRLFPRIANSKVIGEQELAEIIEKETPYTRGMAQAILEDISGIVANLLREGKTIDIPSLGTFRLSVGTDTEVTTSTEISARKAKVKGVNFLPSKELKIAVSSASFRTVARNAAPVAPSIRSIIPTLSEYLDTHDSITRAEFASLFGLKRATACRRLKDLADMGIIKSIGNNREARYTKAE